MELDEICKSQDHVSKSVLDKTVSIKGDINFADTLEIQGSVVGNILPASNTISFLIIGKNSEITGDITSSHVIVSGKVIGNINAQHIEIEESARIFGSVVYKSIEIHSGAKIDGSMTMFDNENDVILNSSNFNGIGKALPGSAPSKSNNSVSLTKIPSQQIEVPA